MANQWSFGRLTADESAVEMIQHLRITHNESYRNLNQPPNYWKEFSIEEAKILLVFWRSAWLANLCWAHFHKIKLLVAWGLRSQGDFLKHNGRIGMSIQQEFCNCAIGTEMLRYTLLLGKEHGFHSAFAWPNSRVKNSTGRSAIRWCFIERSPTLCILPTSMAKG